ncbi:LOW QUALITY PROTEIN: mucin-5AC [Monomorium pharaonis]|uniref:LOW QUALITY PROTEIN: mucin-5AC n=1 Tax=Monomorium pharaonis TaxID=307658 RepID=UPI00174703EC|nr:LOW QUALITY PROTEIN: mucin-5AC [Monomorium pharaonis]
MLRLVVPLLCIAATYTPGRCETGASRDVEHARLPEFLTELDLSSLEASEEDVEALKKIVKRLAPEKNVFFGNEDLLKEWLKGAGVTGQPGLDYPALTSIPATSFSCRGLRGGYYADLETNCQVFHICDNGRKISFLCPNGTIFQQSQLICDWWFKVDCSKSTELYEQSAEQLAEEEKRRAETRKMKSEYHRAEQQGNTDYYENVDYDGRQNGRTNPYGQSAVKQNQIPERQNEPKSNQHFGPNNVFENGRGSGRYFQDNNANALRTNEKTSQTPENYEQPSKQRQYHDGGSNYQTASRQRNQLDTQSGKYNYEHSKKFQDSRQNYQNNAQDHYQSNQNTPPRNNEKSAFNNPKLRTSTRNNLFGSNQSQKATPTYMETTTFRTTTAAPPREYQQAAESAAFVSNRGNRFNSGKSDNGRQYYYHSYDYRDHTTADYRGRETTTSTPRKNEESETVSFTPKTGAPPYPGPTYAPIYKPRTTTLPPYETTLQYTPTTETSYYSTTQYKQGEIPETTYFNAETATVTLASSDEYSTTYNDLRTPPAIGRVPPAPANYQNQQYVDNRVTEQRDIGTSFATTRPYVNTESYRHNVVNVTSTASQDAFSSSTPLYEDPRGQSHANYQNENSIASNIESKDTTVDPWRATLQSFQQNSISSTEKPWISTNAYQQQSSTSKTLSPYDTSFTYKQGKVLSTLGPYIPFTKNYVYSTMTTTPTPKPLTTVPTYSTSNYRVAANNLIPKVKSPSVTSKPKGRATYLPEPSSKPSTTFEDRPYAEREHALSMLHSLQGLENNVESLSEIGAKDGNNRNGPSAPGPSTLHSLALYFATAGDNLNFNETVESIASVEEAEGSEGSHLHNVSVDLPTSILTQHTISSYIELFNLNNALEGNTTMTEFTSEADNVGGEVDDDLEIEQSEGPVNGAKRSNNTKLRELAQVFTHALSAYLQDPDTFKKVLTEIRPTQPPATTTDNGQFEITTLYPTTAEEYASVTKEKDEVLDFSDDTDVTRKRKPSTTFPTTLQPPATTDRSYSTYYTTPYDEYYTTLESQTRRPIYYPSTTLLPPSGSSYDPGDYVESSTQGGNTFAFEVNRAFTTTTNDIQNYDGDTRDSTDLSPVYDNYFPLDEDANRNKIGGFHNNTAGTFQPYGKNVKPTGATPISNYVASSTVASFQNSGVGTTLPSWGRGSAADTPVQDLTPPHYHQHYGNVKSFEVSNSILPNQVRSTTPLPRSKSSYKTASSTVQPFRIRYYDETTTAPSESLATARSSYAKYRNSYKLESNRVEGTRKPVTTTAATTIRDDVETLNPVTATVSDVTPYTATVVRATPNGPVDAPTTRYSNLLNNDHWTSSPMVTQLWETTVFVDPRHINHGLESNVGVTQLPDTIGNTINEKSESTAAASTTRPPTLSTIDLDLTTEPRTTSTPSPWQWATSDNDPPVTFTLLPTTHTAENTATPTPIITTRSSITTTITSSVTSTNGISRDHLASTLLPFVAGNALNASESEVITAHEMFGKLNETSSNTLMRVMKQADNNATVRQLVLLLIKHCNGPKDKTMEQEKEQLLDALLRMPVNEFNSEESREIIAGINRLNLSNLSKPRATASSRSTTMRTPRASSVRPTPFTPSITTFRSRTGRKFRTTTESASVIARRSDDAVSETNNSLSENEATASDSRALELLRSLYTIAAKWG